MTVRLGTYLFKQGNVAVYDALLQRGQMLLEDRLCLPPLKRLTGEAALQ